MLANRFKLQSWQTITYQLFLEGSANDVVLLIHAQIQKFPDGPTYIRDLIYIDVQLKLHKIGILPNLGTRGTQTFSICPFRCVMGRDNSGLEVIKLF